MNLRWALPLLLLFVAACDVSTGPVSSPAPTQTQNKTTTSSSDIPAATRLKAERAARQFVEVVETVEPVAERECRRRAPGMNCDFQIVVDDRPGQAPNAFQTLDRNGRPVLAFNLALIASVRNADELAFVMGHESAHHIRGHLARARENAIAGAVIFSGLTALTGGSADAVRSAQELGAAVGARSYSKDFELEADELGTVITARAGYDPVRGAEFFTRIPDPGNKFLGSHPPNAERIKTVQRTAASL